MKKYFFRVLYSVILGWFLYSPDIAILYASEESPYLNAVRQYADNVLKYGRDTYGHKKTPLLADGINIYTLQSPKWNSQGQFWILSNLANQQNLLRTLDGLTTLTKIPKYREQALQILRYAFQHIQHPNGLLYWGGHVSYDLFTDKPVADEEKVEKYTHELKCHYPYYPLMWQADPKATQKFINALWASYVSDWKILDFNRHGKYTRFFHNDWDNTYHGGPVFFWGDGLTFLNAGSELFYSAGMLSHFTQQSKPPTWAKRLAHRYVETQNSKTGLGGYQFSQSASSHCDGPGIRGDRARYQFGDYFKDCFVVEGTLFPCYGNTPQTAPCVCQLQLGEILDTKGKEFIQWAHEDLIAWSKIPYRWESNEFIPMFTDGTSLEGFVIQKPGYFGPKGRVITAGHAGFDCLWAYALAFRLTGDPLMWKMARNIASHNSLGDIGPCGKNDFRLNFNTQCPDPYALFAILELYRKTDNPQMIKFASKIGDNLMEQTFQKGFFLPGKDYRFAHFGTIQPLALLHLHAALYNKIKDVPHAWINNYYFSCEYDQKGVVNDIDVIYNQKISHGIPENLSNNNFQ